MNLIHVTKDHPLYEELLTALDPDIFEQLRTRKEAGSTAIPNTPEVDWKRLREDYNNLDKGTALAFVVIAQASASSLMNAISRRGLTKKSDYLLYTLPILSIESASLVGRAPSELISEREFRDYACMSEKDWPDPDEHPNVAAMDQAIPRRSNRHTTADMLPQFRHMWQVYLIRTSDKLMKMPPKPRGVYANRGELTSP
jgi:hypothetical protein